MRSAALAVFLCLPMTATASQPISESFVECAQLFDMSNRWEPSRRATEKGATLSRIAGQMMEAAAVEAQGEGRSDVAGYLEGLAVEKAAGWDSKGPLYVITEDFRDWMSYCRKLSQSRGLVFER